MPKIGNTVKRHANLFLFLSVILISGILAESFPTFRKIEYFGKSTECASFIERAENAGLSLSARSAVLIECESGDIIYGKNENERLPMASTTKIMTALVVLESCSLSDVIKIPKEATGIEGSSIYMREGEEFSVEELLYALLLSSANDAATALALHTSGSIDAFAEKMNEKAKELGLTDTHFENPHGLDADSHYTTAKELALIAREASRNAKFREITSTKKKIIRRESKESARLLVNHNKLLSQYEGCFGIKTGFTKRCGRCLVSGAERNGLSLIAVTLSAPDDWRDHKELLDFGFSKYASKSLADVGSIKHEMPVTGSYQTSVICRNRDALSVVLPSSFDGKIEMHIEARRFLFAPIYSGDTVGRAVFTLDGKEIASLPLYAEFSAAKRKN